MALVFWFVAASSVFVGFFSVVAAVFSLSIGRAD
jgi:hypothetical protein